MSNTKKKTTIQLTTVFFVLAVAFKFLGIIQWHWLIILSIPIWFPILCLIGVMIFMITIAFILVVFKK